MTKHPLEFLIKFGRGGIFIGEPLKSFLVDLYKGHVLGFFGANLW